MYVCIYVCVMSKANGRYFSLEFANDQSKLILITSCHLLTIIQLCQGPLGDNSVLNGKNVFVCVYVCMVYCIVCFIDCTITVQNHSRYENIAFKSTQTERQFMWKNGTKK